MRRSARILIASSCLLAPACGSSNSDDSGGGPQPIAVTEDTFAEAMVAAICSGGPQCCAKEGKQFDQLSCVATAGLIAGFAPVTQAQAKSLGLSWDQAAAEACVNNLSAASQSCGATPLDETLCQRIYAPNVGPGGACEADMQCIWPEHGRAECYWPADADKYCLQIQFVGEGGACDSLDTECDPAANLYCDLGTDTCLPRKAEGEPCASSDHCAEELRCQGRTCAPRAATGEACGTTNDCAEGNCSGGVCQPPIDVVCL